MRAAATAAALAAVLALAAAAAPPPPPPPSSWVGPDRCVLQTRYGDIELALWTGPASPAPLTAAHILKLCSLGAYAGNHFFRVDKGFVAQVGRRERKGGTPKKNNGKNPIDPPPLSLLSLQVADVATGRLIPLDARQTAAAAVTLPLETSPAAKHAHRGLLSLARHDDPHSGGSSFSVMLGAAPHLDGHYAVFGHVVRGSKALAAMEGVATKTEGIFVMPLERIAIDACYVHRGKGGGGGSGCAAALGECRAALAAAKG